MRRSIFSLISGILFLFLIAWGFVQNRGDYCVSPNLFYMEITPTIKAIYSYSDSRQKSLGYRTLIRGDIQEIGLVDDYLIGYLSTKNFGEDSLLGLEGEHDKEGYFVLDVRGGDISSGLSRSAFEAKLKSDVGVSLDQVDLRTRPEFYKKFWLSCE